MGELKPGWKIHRFDEMVTTAGATRKARGWTADEAGVDRYVGLEHLDSNSLTIRRWGSPDDVGDNSDLRHFEPGDVLLARRGIELRKVGVPRFRGVASGHALVFRARPDVVLPDFLAFFVQSDAFMGRADQFSMGSLSHTVNQSTLLRQEFALPPLREQARAVAMLQASASYLTSAQDLLDVAAAAEKAEIQWWFRDKARWPSAPTQHLGQVQLGQQKHPKYEAGVAPRPYLRVPNITDGYLNLNEIASMDFVGKDFVKHRLQAGDILVTEGDLIGPRTVGRSAMFRGEIADCCVQKTILRFRPGPKLIPAYALWACRHLRYDGVFAKACTGSTVAHLTSEKFKEVPVPLAPLSVQRDIASAVDRWSAARAAVQERVRSAEALHRGHLAAPWSE